MSYRSIAVAGKGGTGKTTLAALITKYLISRKSGPVLVLDADPDANLGTMLGAAPQKTIGDLREDAVAAVKNLGPGQTKAAYLEAGLNEVIIESQGFDMIAMGRGEGPGCYCYLNNLIRSFADNLMSSYSWVVMDNEAGLEHLSRRTSANIDMLFITVTESPLSVNTAKNVASILGTIKNSIKHAYTVTSMIRPENMDAVRQRLSAIPLENAGDIPRDQAVENAIMDGKSLLTMDNSPAYNSVCDMMKRIIP